jgi:transcriptional regulator with XRE-family HTH domain
MAFGDVLKAIRERVGMSQDRLARAADLSTSAVAKLEQGLVEPSWATVRALCKALGVPCAAFECDDKAGAPAAPPRRRGRPRKTPAEGEATPKKTRRRRT